MQENLLLGNNSYSFTPKIFKLQKEKDVNIFRVLSKEILLLTWRLFAWVIVKFSTIAYQRLNVGHLIKFISRPREVGYVSINTTSLSENKEVFYQWLVGFTDGDGTLSIVRQNDKWSLTFKLSQSTYNLRILHFIKTQLKVGSIYIDNDGNHAHFRIRDRVILEKYIFPIFDKYPLLTTKQFNYIKFKEAHSILNNPSLNKLEKDSLIFNLVNTKPPVNYISPAWSIVDNKVSNFESASKVISKAWLVGFTEAEGSFYLVEKSSNRLVHAFEITQKLDKIVLTGIKYILGISTNVKVTKLGTCALVTTNSRAIENIIEYYKNTMKGLKSFEFNLWSRSYYKTKSNPDNKKNFNNLCKINKLLTKINSKLKFNNKLDIENFSKTVEPSDNNRYKGSLILANNVNLGKRSLHTSSNISNLNPFYVTGFSDAESTFVVSIVKRSYMKTGWSVAPIFKIELHKKDLSLLNQIKSFFEDVGNITLHKTRNSASYTVSSIKELNNIIIPHFEKYPLISQKRADYLLFKSVVDSINKSEHLTYDGINQIVAIRSSMNLGLTTSLKESFPNIIPVLRPVVINQEIPDIHWFIGFSEGESCFFVDIIKSKTHKVEYQVKLKFQITQHSRDLKLMNNLLKFLNCGNLREVVGRSAVDLVITKISDIDSKIVPLFTNFPLKGNKNLDFLDFCKVFFSIKNKDHLTIEGLEYIKQIKSRMNTKRSID
jgi:hypothetical protein